MRGRGWRRSGGAAHLLAPRPHLLRLSRDETLPVQFLHYQLPHAARAVAAVTAVAAGPTTRLATRLAAAARTVPTCLASD